MTVLCCPAPGSNLCEMAQIDLCIVCNIKCMRSGEQYTKASHVTCCVRRRVSQCEGLHVLVVTIALNPGPFDLLQLQLIIHRRPRFDANNNHY